MDLEAAILAAFDDWAARNAEAASTATAYSAERDKAAAVAAAEMHALFGDVDGDDAVIVNYGFMEAVSVLRSRVPLSVSADLERALERWDKRKMRLREIRKAEEDKPRRVSRDRTELVNMYPYGRLPVRRE